MPQSAITVEPLAQVAGGRTEPTDDYWGATRALLRIDADRFDERSVAGIEEFSYLEVVFFFHLTDQTGLNLGARRPRDNPDWPEVGAFGHRNMRRLNWLGISRCRLLKVDGLDLHVEDLDAVDGTLVIEVKPWFAEFGPSGEYSVPLLSAAEQREHVVRNLHHCLALRQRDRAQRFWVGDLVALDHPASAVGPVEGGGAWWG